MAALPREVRHEQRAVQHVPDGVLQSFVVGEGVVSALVRDHPASRGEGAVGDGVREPGGPVGCLERDVQVREESRTHGEGGGDDCVRHGLDVILLPALFGDVRVHFVHLRPVLVLNAQRLSLQS